MSFFSERYFGTNTQPDAQPAVGEFPGNMDIAYDHIQENSLPRTDDDETKKDAKQAPQQQPTLNEDIQEAYKAFSSSAWGSRIGGFFGTVVKQVCAPGRSVM